MPEDTLVEPLHEREPDSVPGPFYVIKDACIICGLPPETAPQNITWSALTVRRSCQIPVWMAGPDADGGEECPTHCRIERQPQTPKELDLVIEAACGSCVEAIRYCGTDPKILARFRDSGHERLCDAIARQQQKAGLENLSD